MSKEDFEDYYAFNSSNIQWYKYKCPSCGAGQDVEDVVVDAYFYSKGCKKGEYPKLTCPKCHDGMECIGSYESAPEGR